ncbi:hypothetical protein KAW65_00170 [candidate division WOR-3 bacterium]|nr:hypothetical protein [candidate division WOR-3 bacterium]
MGKECDHEWKDVKDWKDKLKIKYGEIIEIPQKCMKCGLEGYEVWVYSCIVDKEDNEVH